MRGKSTAWRAIAAITALLVAVAGVLGALKTLGVNLGSSPKAELNVTIDQVHRDPAVTLVAYSVSSEIAATRPSLWHGARGIATTSGVIRTDTPTLRVAIALGTQVEVQTDSDGDGDGVPDTQDKCPNTSAQTANGCPASSLDSDGDGVPDTQDKCPNTSAQTANGCPASSLDSDGDGVPDTQDKCPNTSAQTANGCPASSLDSDGDGVPDTQDKCPNTSAQTANGCPASSLDSDGDGVPDTQDKCPNTSAQTANGCPASSLDSDGDGVPDTQDKCPNTSAQTADGRPASSLDSDGDGVPDTQDKCPNTSAQTANGCPRVLAQVLQVSGCTAGELQAAVDASTQPNQDDRPACTSVVDLAQGLPGGNSRNQVTRAKAINAVVRATRTQAVGSGKPPEPLGVPVSARVTLDGFTGQRVELRWSLYRRGGGVVPKAWLKQHRVLSLTGEASKDTAVPRFWVPLPKRRGPYFVRIEAFNDKNVLLASRDTKPFR